jgi:hypothetical protein
MKLKSDMSTMSEIIVNKEKQINSLTIDSKHKEEQYMNKIGELSAFLDEKQMHIKEISERSEKLEKELLEMVYFNYLINRCLRAVCVTLTRKMIYLAGTYLIANFL